jgi:dynein heavy chain
MIVGPTGGGKTTCYKVLQHALNALKEKDPENKSRHTIKAKVLNPKSISMGELYG